MTIINTHGIATMTWIRGLVLTLVFGVAILVTLAARAGATPVVPGDRPNFLIIYTDDQRWDSLSLAGHPFLKTPDIDRIGREGAVFNNSFVTSPLCSPSRASLLTGQYAHTHRVRTNEGAEEISFNLETFPKYLQQAGYRTGYLGKFHMGESAEPRPGFDRWMVVPGQGRYIDPLFNLDGREVLKKGYIADIVTEGALEFIDQPSDRPFCLVVAHKGPHSPFIPAPRHVDDFSENTIERRPNSLDDLSGKPMLQRHVTGWPDIHAGSGPGDELVKNQLRTLESIDEGTGRLLEALRRTGELDRTVVIFTSDNGYYWGEHGLGDKRAPYEEGIRVPLLVRYPPLIGAGTHIDAMVLNIDIAPTLLELAGVPVPSEMHGKSLLPVLGPNPIPDRQFRSVFLGEYTVQYPDQPRIATWVGVRTDRWKFIRYPTLPEMDEFYDLRADPFELRNLAMDPAAADTLADVRGQLNRLLAETNHPGRYSSVSGVLIDNWHAMTARGYQDARTRTRNSLLTDGNFNSGYAIMATDGTLTPILKADRDRVAAYLGAETREVDFRVRADFYDEGLGRWLTGLWPVLGHEDGAFVEENGMVVMEAEHAQRTDGYRTLSLRDASGGFAVQAGPGIGDRDGTLEFRFELRQSGVWRLWMRTFAAHHRQNGVVLSIDRKPLAAPPGHELEGTTDISLRESGEWTAWNWVPEWQPTHAQEKRGLKHHGPITVRLESGVHTLMIHKRESERPLIDKVVLSLAADPPHDLGPTESTIVRRPSGRIRYD